MQGVQKMDLGGAFGKEYQGRFRSNAEPGVSVTEERNAKHTKDATHM